MTKFGEHVEYGGERWFVAAIGWIGERYYWLTRENETAMVPASIIDAPIEEEPEDGERFDGMS